MKNIYKKILLKKEQNQKMLAVLLDPDQCKGSLLSSTIAILKNSVPDFIFVGGSFALTPIDSLIELLREETKAEIVLFPGNGNQLSEKADALLYLSLLSGRNAEFLIGQHIHTSLAIKNSDLEVISTGYLLIDGGKTSSVEYMSNTRPIPRDKKEIVLSTALAAELMGMKAVYLEAGSGALNTVPVEMINFVSNDLSLPLIVGGGIKTTNTLNAIFDAGADIAVVGNVFEKESKLIAEFVECTHNYGLKNNLP